MAQNMELAALQASLKQAGAQWQASATSMSALSAQERRMHLGAVPPKGTPTLQEREQTASAKFAAEKEQVKAEVAAYPASFDLRNVGGNNYITAVTDQGGCGSCVAFGSTATVEGTFQWQRRNPNLKPDLSEAQLFYCIGEPEGASCANGWWPDQAFDGYKNNGIAPEAFFPYTAHDQACAVAANWQASEIKISGWRKITSSADMKTWLSTNGPLSTCFTVYDDFFSYSSGVYSHTSGNVAGGHCVSVVGYDDTHGCWICKNSWSADWGAGGFFQIAYGQCGIDAEMWAVEGIVETMWFDNVSIGGVWTIDQDRNAYAWINTVGWRKLASNNDNIFHDQLIQLLAAKAGGRPCNVYEEQGIITQLYVL